MSKITVPDIDCCEQLGCRIDILAEDMDTCCTSLKSKNAQQDAQINILKNDTATLDAKTAALKLKDDQLDDRIDNIITSPAPSAQEVIDARLGNNGITYTSLGEAIRSQFEEVDETLTKYNVNEVKLPRPASSTYNGITWTYIPAEDRYRANGTATGTSFINLIADDFPKNMAVGDTVYVHVESTDNDVRAAIYRKVNGTYIDGTFFSSANDRAYTVPSGSEGLIVRLYVNQGTTVSNAKAMVYITTAPTNKSYQKNVYWSVYPNGADLDDAEANTTYELDSSFTYGNFPSDEGIQGRASVLETMYLYNGFAMQRLTSIANRVWVRFRNISGTWTSWRSMMGTNGNAYSALPYTTESGGDRYLDLDDMIDGGYYVLDTSWTISNKPIDFNPTLLIVQEFRPNKVTGFVRQIVGTVTTSNHTWYERKSNATGDWGAWSLSGSGGGGGGNIFNEYNNTYNVTATPTITTDTNSYLAPTGNTSDRTNDIVTMLTQTGVCRLGKGTYYVKNLVMPQNTSIIGSGDSSILRLIDGDNDCFAVAPKDYCTIKDCAFVGASSSITPQATVRTRDAIRWQGTYTHTQQAPVRCMLNNLYISRFAGSGVKLYDTGYSGNCSVIASSLFVWNCDAGINIDYWSEYNKFTSVRSSNNYYGCINNGGNNMFVNCDFSTNKLLYLMDNSSGQMPNDSHGSCVGCTFNHADDNSGVGIRILGCVNGFVFTGCQIWYSQIQIENSYGVTISDSNLGSTNCNVRIVGGRTVMFANNLWQAAPSVTVTGNNYVFWLNNYNKSTGALITG